MNDDDKDRNFGKNFSNNGRKPRGNTDFDYFYTNSGGDTDILSQTSNDSSVSELESGQLVLGYTTAKKKKQQQRRKMVLKKRCPKIIFALLFLSLIKKS